MPRPISVLGFGAWGGALAIHLARHGAGPITAWEHMDSLRASIRSTGWHPNLGPQAKVPESITLVDQMDRLPFKNSIFILAVASDYLAATLVRFKKEQAAKARPYACVILTKGLEPDSLNFFSGAARRILGLPAKDIFMLTGPTIAKELLAGAPTQAVLAGPKNQKRQILCALLNQGNLMVQPEGDIIGAQIGGSMKNIYAIGYGILEAGGAAANARAFYLLKALEEMKRMAKIMGGKPETITGPAGLGDLLTTSFSPNSRNSRLGRMLMEGKSPEEIQKEIGMVTEGVQACAQYLKLAARKRAALPVAGLIGRILKGSSQAHEFLLGLQR